MNNYLVSIIMPNYNGERFLSQTLESVLNQTYQNWELLFIDDGSTDNSVEIAKSYAQKDKRISISFTQFPKIVKGPASARNTAFSIAKGKYFAFLDSDDIWHKTKLERQLDFMTANNVALCYCWYDVINENNEIVGEVKPITSVNYKELLKDQRIGTLTAIYDAKKYSNLKIDPTDIAADLSLWLQILKNGETAYCIAEKLASYRLVSGSLSSNKLKAIGYYWNVVRNIEKLNFFQSSYYFCHYAFRGIFKKLKFLKHRYNL